MINDERYLNNILPLKEKYQIYFNITRNVYLSYLATLLLFIGALCGIGFMVFYWIDQNIAIIFFIFTFVFLGIAILIAFLTDMDFLSSKPLNIRLYIYLCILEEYIERNEKTQNIRMVNLKIIKLYNILIKNIENTFIFYSPMKNIELISNINQFHVNSLIGLYKNKSENHLENRELILNFINSVKYAYYSAETLTLYKPILYDRLVEHDIHIELIHNSLKDCLNKKETTEKENKFISLLINIMRSRLFLSIVLIVVVIALLMYINIKKDYSQIPANIGVISILIGLGFPIWASKKDK